jgi:uncharacterized membrane protein (DUF373 family)
LLATIEVLFVSTEADLLAVREGSLRTALTVLERVILIFIIVELSHRRGRRCREQRIVAELFLLVGMIAVVRSILLVLAEAERATPEEFLNTAIKLGMLTALMSALAAGFYSTTRRAGPQASAEGSG